MVMCQLKKKKFLLWYHVPRDLSKKIFEEVTWLSGRNIWIFKLESLLSFKAHYNYTAWLYKHFETLVHLILSYVNNKILTKQIKATLVRSMDWKSLRQVCIMRCGLSIFARSEAAVQKQSLCIMRNVSIP